MRILKLRGEETNAGRRHRGRSRYVGFLAATISRLAPKRTSRVTTRDLKARDFRTSTQRIGVRFSERLRDAFRFRWIRRAR
jgi:hypothetical protein